MTTKEQHLCGCGCGEPAVCTVYCTDLDGHEFTEHCCGLAAQYISECAAEEGHHYARVDHPEWDEGRSA